MSSETPAALAPLQLDALREVANIGAGHAASALSQMTSRRVMISVPSLTVHARADVHRLLPDPAEQVVAVDVHMLGELTGKTILVFRHTAARHLASILTMRNEPPQGELSVMERSAIQEVGNILASAYLNALSEMIGGVLLPTPPVVETGAGAEVVRIAATRSPGSDPVLTIDTRFDVEGSPEVGGTFFVLPDHSSLKRLLEALRVT